MRHFTALPTLSVGFFFTAGDSLHVAIQLHRVSKLWVSRRNKHLIGEAAIVFALFVLLGIVYRQVTPLFETPDEPSHFSVINYIADTKSLPPFPARRMDGPVPLIEPGVPTYYAPPLYYALAALFIGNSETEGFFAAVQPNPDFARQRGINFNDSYSSKNMYIHLAEQRQPRAPWAEAMWRLRWLSLCLGASTAVSALLLGKLLWRDVRWAWLAASLVGLNSSFLYLSNGISNDPLLIAICSWSMLLLVWIGVKPSPKPGWRVALVVLLIAMGLLTKQTAAFLVPPALFVLVRQRWGRREKTAVFLQSALVVGLLGGSWYLNNWLQKGDPLGFSSHNALPPMAFGEHMRFFANQLSGTFQSYWGAYGWATIFVGQGWYLFFGVILAGGLVGWLGSWVVGWLDGDDGFAGLAGWLLWLGVLGNGALMSVWLWRTAAPYGRLLFPVIVPSACLLVEGWRRLLVRWPIVQWIWHSAVLLVVATFALIAPSRYIAPALAAPIATPNHLAAQNPFDAQFGDAIHLVGYAFAPPDPQVGEQITLWLHWRTVEPLVENQTVVVHIAPLDAQYRVATESHWLGTARYPTSIWQVGETIRQEMRLTVDDSATAPTLYWFNIVVQSEDGALLPAETDSVAQQSGLVRLGPFRLASDKPPAPLANALNYTFSDAFTLLGYETALDRTSRRLRVTLQWRGERRYAVDQTVFIHLVDADRRLITQHDQQPRNGGYPTSWWQPGDVVTERIFLDVPETAVFDQLHLRIGLYDSATSDRLPVKDSDGAPLSNDFVVIEWN